jgi:outer membrane protein assembly factor BamB
MLKMRWIGAWLLLALVGLAGCSTAEKVEPAKLEPISPEVNVVELWNQRVGGYGGQLLKYAPVISGDQLFVVGHDGLVAALNKANGRTAWSRNLRLPISAGLGADQRHLYLAVFDGRVIALNREDGTQVWEARVSSEVLAPPQSNGSLVVAQTIDGKLFGLDADSGTQRWRYDSVQPVLTIRGTATPLVTPELTFAGFANGDVVALDSVSGGALWERKVGVPTGRTELERLVDIDGGFVLESGALFTVGYQSKLVALDARSGQEIWSKPASSLRKPVIGYSNVYVAGSDGDVIATNAVNQAVVWRQEGLKHRALSAPAVFQNTLMVGDFEGYMHFLALDDGRFMARIRPDTQGMRSQPVVENGVVYILGNSGRLSAWRIRGPRSGS